MKKIDGHNQKPRDAFFLWAVPCAVAIIVMGYLAGKDRALRDNRTDQIQTEMKR